MKRYQECSWLVRLWRRRWYLLIPWRAVEMWVAEVHYQSTLSEEKLKEHWALSFGICWKLAIGLAQCKMKWYYTMEEVRERMKKRIEERKQTEGERQ